MSPAEAEAAYRRAMTVRAGYAPARLTLAALLLTLGRCLAAAPPYGTSGSPSSIPTVPSARASQR